MTNTKDERRTGEKNRTAPLFATGLVTLTKNAKTKLTLADLCAALGRHQRGDWGDVCSEDREANDLALQEMSRLLSVYHSADGTKFWVITEADRSSTTVLLPEDY